jgi:hypothetical protein
MRIQTSRLLRHLSRHGFALVHNGGGGKTCLVRPDSSMRTIQWIVVDSSGKKGEAAVAYIGVGVTRRIAFKGLLDLQLLEEIAEDKDRGWTIIITDQDALAWEEKLIRVAPRCAKEFASEHGPILLQRTEAVRNAVGKYLSHLDTEQAIEGQLKSLERRASERMLTDGERLAGWPGVVQIPEASAVYRLACLAIVSFEHEVEENRRPFAGQNPLEDDGLMWRIQLIADELLCRQNAGA